MKILGSKTPVWILFVFSYLSLADANPLIDEPVQACIVTQDVDLTEEIRASLARCLGWHSDLDASVCLGRYQSIVIPVLNDPEQIRVFADKVSFYQNRRTSLKGHVEIQQNQRIVNAQTAYLYRDPKTKQVVKIEFLGNVRYLEPGKLLIARKATLHPQTNSGEIQDVLYRFNVDRSHATLPAWGMASLIQRFANKNYLLLKASYSTCPPQDKAWDIKADSISIDDANAKGVARKAVIRINEWPLFYTPYLSFPTNKDRKSGFLMPMLGYSNVNGFDFGLPYYWNMAPNHDFTFIPHVYTERGLMLGGEYRYLTANGAGFINGNFLPKDRAFTHFLENNETEFPRLKGVSSNRWAYNILNSTNIAPNLQFNANLQQVSDDYYLQDFSTNLALITQRQLLRQADLTYSTEHWIFRGMGQSYQTLHPVNETPIASVYERLPQLLARGYYYDLPFDSNLNILGQYDQFHWPVDSWDRAPFGEMPEGPRFHLNPILSLPIRNTWGYINPSVEFVENYYKVTNNYSYHDLRYLETWDFPNIDLGPPYVGSGPRDFNRLIPRYSLDGGLYFDRDFNLKGNSYTQTLEPRLFYLQVPYQDQSAIPVYDSGFLIFNVDQLFRTNRFSGFDRIGDANQLAYALTSRWLSETGEEFANWSIGQIRYFSDRKVQLCRSESGFCFDNHRTLGYLSPFSKTSPIASRGAYYFNPVLGMSGDYVWDPATHATNNGDFNLHYRPKENGIVHFGYSYLVNGDVTQVWHNGDENSALHQAIVSFSWPMSEKWSSVGIYSHNISKNYSMMSLFGLQYDSCCWAMRILGGRTFKNLNAGFEPQYNNNVYLQFLFKGLGSVANSDPNNLLNTYIPGYQGSFSH